MKTKMKLLFFILFLLISTNIFAWRIENNILFLEKNDNVWEVTYCLCGDGNKWKILWEKRIDKTIKSPYHAYPNMAFNLNDSLFISILSLDTTCCKDNSSFNKTQINIENLLESINCDVDTIADVVIKYNDKFIPDNPLKAAFGAALWALAIGFLGGILVEIVMRVYDYIRQKKKS